MPVAVRDLLAGAIEPSLRAAQRPAQVLAFLRERPEQAFSAAELSQEFGTDHRTMRTVLARLHSRSLVDKKGDYWFALDEDGIATKRAFLRASRDLDESLGREEPRHWPAASQPDP